jgi:hypothetical protein
MSVKKYQQVNSSHNAKCQNVISQINIYATDKDVTVCKKLTNRLKRLLNNFTDLDDFYKWLGKETIEMSDYSCDKYARRSPDDKIDI